MSLGLRGRLFLVSLILSLSIGITSAVYLEHELGRWLETRLERELAAQAKAAAITLKLLPANAHPEKVDRLADALGDAISGRVTIIASDGRVLGDSHLDLAGVAKAENHATRPEVIEARIKGLGTARRVSETVETAMLYLAVPEGPSQARIVRVARPLSMTNAAVDRIRWLLFFASALGLALAIFISFWASSLLSKRLRELLERARAMADGKITERGKLSTGDELSILHRSLSRLEQALEEVVETLARERDRFGAVLQGMEEAVVVVNDERRVILVNQSAQRLLDLSANVAGMPVLDLIDSAELGDALDHAFKDQPTSLEFDFKGPEVRYFLARVAPQKAAGGCVIVLRDVTRLRRLETMRRDFVANVSHELRTPVSVIRLNAEALGSGAIHDPSRGPKFISALLRNAERLSDLVSDLLDVSRIESGDYAVRSDLIDVREIANIALQNVEQLADEKETRLTCTIPTPLMAKADSNALQHVLNNLLQNAVKYTADGGRVILEGMDKGHWVRIAVRDNGPGIPEKHRARVFERFYRVDPGRSKAMGGTGLGLAIVKHLTLSMGGRVGVDGNEPKGAVFWVDLPSSQGAGLDSEPDIDAEIA